MAAHDLEGQLVVVTGAAGRLGRHVVRHLAQAGATLAVLDLDAAALHGVAETAHPFAADATREASVQRAFGEIEAQLGVPDALVHTVGTWGAAPLAETALEDWQQLVDLNLTSAFLCFRAAARLMQKRPEGTPARLVGIASGQGADRGAAEQGAYSAAKAGVVRLVEAVAAEYAGTGLTAHAIAPSTILFDGVDAQKGVRPERLAALCAYLLTPAADALSGATLRAYGTAR